MASSLPDRRHALGVHVEPLEHLAPAERAAMDAYFDVALSPLLTPVAVLGGQRLPLIARAPLSLAVVLKRPGRKKRRVACVGMPLQFGPVVPVESRPGAVVAVEALVRASLGRLFPGMTVEGVWSFRVASAAEAGSPEAKPARRFEAEALMPGDIRALLTRALGLDPDRVCTPL